jgi:REP element-mobilizing transposase RayT
MDISEKNDMESKPALSESKTGEKATIDSNNDVLLESIHPEAYDISYTCLLIPGQPNQQLKGDLAELLPQWLKQICTSYHWQIEFITVNPDYFQWGLRVIPSTQTGQFMQKIRNKTSELILSKFEKIHGNNSNNDFWATGYLVVLGTRPHPKEMIEQYIRLSRRQQESSPA